MSNPLLQAMQTQAPQMQQASQAINPMQVLNQSMPEIQQMAQQIKGVVSSGGNPMDIMGKMFGNNPMAQLAMGGNLEQVIKDKCAADGLDFNELYKMASDAYR